MWAWSNNIKSRNFRAGKGVEDNYRKRKREEKEKKKG